VSTQPYAIIGERDPVVLRNNNASRHNYQALPREMTALIMNLWTYQRETSRCRQDDLPLTLTQRVAGNLCACQTERGGSRSRINREACERV